MLFLDIVAYQIGVVTLAASFLVSDLLLLYMVYDRENITITSSTVLGPSGRIANLETGVYSCIFTVSFKQNENLNYVIVWNCR